MHSDYLFPVYVLRCDFVIQRTETEKVSECCFSTDVFTPLTFSRHLSSLLSASKTMTLPSLFASLSSFICSLAVFFSHPVSSARRASLPSASVPIIRASSISEHKHHEHTVHMDLSHQDPRTALVWRSQDLGNFIKWRLQF